MSEPQKQPIVMGVPRMSGKAEYLATLEAIVKLIDGEK